MDIIATQIRQIGREIVLEGNSIIGYQHSANLYVKLIKDESHDNPFAGMVLSAYCSTLSEQMPIACPLEEREDGTYILLNHKVFEQHGDVYLSLGGMNEEAVVVTSNNLVLQVDESNNIIAYVSPEEEYWQIEVLNAMKAWYASVVDPVFCENKEKLNQLIQQTEEHEEKVEELQTKAEQQQEQVDTLLTEANTAIQHAENAATQANNAAHAANTAKTNAEAAATKANDAAEASNDITEEINRKLQNGELKGDPGDRGADGITPSIGNNGNWFIGNIDTGLPSRGEKGETGDKGDPGTTSWDGIKDKPTSFTPSIHNHNYSVWSASQLQANGYMGFYGASGSTTRKGWIGHNGGNTLIIANEADEAVRIQSNGGRGGGLGINLYATKNDGCFNHMADDALPKHWFNNTVSAIAWETRSTENIKTNIIPFEALQVSKQASEEGSKEAVCSALEIVLNSQIYQYDLIDEIDKGIDLNKHYGFVIGREAPKELLTYNTVSKEPTGIDLYSMSAIVWQAVKELLLYVEMLEKRIRED
ncbi:MAG: hypothetical protein HFE68_03620 [Erysipelotrichaceae bacterium]|nr:hypothetical protein [Erysipelotrichaceae bacterium]